MSSFPRRSARLSPHSNQSQQGSHPHTQNTMPSLASHSQASSTSTTSHPSPNNDNSNPPPPPSTPQQPGVLSIQPHNTMSQQPHHHVPLPSPSATEAHPFFGRQQYQPTPYQPHQAVGGGMSTQTNQAAYDQQRHEQQSHHLHPHSNSMSHPNSQQMNGINPSQLPPDFLAEAAKRAQIACLMRDMGDVTL